jgi:hypothetical protein
MLEVIVIIRFEITKSFVKGSYSWDGSWGTDRREIKVEKLSEMFWEKVRNRLR